MSDEEAEYVAAEAAPAPSVDEGKIKFSMTLIQSAAQKLGRKEDISGEEDSLWRTLDAMWHHLVDAFCHPTTQDDESVTEELIPQTLATARLMKLLAATNPSYQVKTFENEPQIRILLHHFTSYQQSQDETMWLASRLTAQTLSNIVTSNEPLISSLWAQYMELPDEQNIIIRLLAHPDIKTKMAVLVILLNSLHQSSERSLALCTTPAGTRIIITFLDQTASLFDESSPEGEQAFQIAYTVFKNLFDLNLSSRLWDVVQQSELPITPPRTTLLKLLDSYLQSPPQPPLTPTFKFLIPAFSSLVTSAQEDININVSDADTSTREAIYRNGNSLLPSVCEAIVLAAQCLISILLREEEGVGDTGDTMGKGLKAYGVGEAGGALVERIVDLLRSLDRFLPSITFAKSQQTPSSNTTNIPDPKGFAYVKRDVVRLLGILCHADQKIQDRMRECGGVQCVMNLCVIDERNPYLREHALFALRNLLERNKENQAIVEEMKPMAEWDDNGVLRNVDGRTRK